MNQRLIDANALSKQMQSLKEKYTHKNELLYTVEEQAIAEAMKLIDSAPTVETTDDVLKRVSTSHELELRFSKNWYWESWIPSIVLEQWKTPIEAVTRLESSLNRK